MSEASHPDRRGFLRRSIAIVPAAAALTASIGSAQSPPASSPSSFPPGGSSQGSSSPSNYSPVYFNASEWAFVKAAVARLIPSDDTGPGAIEAGVPEFIDRQMEGAFGHASTWYTQGPFLEASPLLGYQGKMVPREVYRAGIAATDARCRKQYADKGFAQLSAAQQDEVLKGLEAGSFALEGVGATDFFGYLLQNTKEGYFSDPIHGGNKNAEAWKMIGFPGARADFADWVDKPGARYNLPPVSIAGPQG
ncbi:Gluconate 2-dehydrogenase subunit 3 precursor [Variovorax sp. SRS16]|uniref:gluconate 2-dehydrogenase subunit 3 family protein n=1 Tax=Variovorax sp. SRS16 TaxID=282217 RepID=UPI001319648B|nr:gluconate 2-dehydrogenase subunit 3 family protein [Variovorax sp. SRS16]VTU17584.1 Gluconate 2-dehydrogenase subunit 3 precursor [Variovorax sp. SRS16]